MRLPIRVQRDIARLHFHDPEKSNRCFARSLGISPATVSSLRKRLRPLVATWEELKNLDDAEWERTLGTGNSSIAKGKPKPEWAYIHSELQRPDATLEVLWREWREGTPNGIGYSSFTQGYRDWLSSRSIVMRQVHRPGERLFVDFAGRTVPIHNADGTTYSAQIFIAVLGFSNRTFAWAVEDQTASSFAECHVKCFESLNGVPKWVVPDNLKAAVISRTRDTLELNATYRACLAHYGTAAMPARPRRPRDKSKAEVGVQIAQRWILFSLRDRQFFDRTELNAELTRLMDQMNRRPFKKLPGSREEMFEHGERESLMPLPATPYEAEDWRYGVRVGRDHHVEHDGCHYSVPSEAAGRQVDLRFTKSVLEVLMNGRRLTLHPLAKGRGVVTTLDEHRPLGHRRVLEGEPLALANWASDAPPSTKAMMRYHLEQRSDLTNGLKTARRLRDLAHDHGGTRFEEACAYALALNITALRSVESILKTNPDKRVAPGQVIAHAPHENIRGPGYFGGKE